MKFGFFEPTVALTLHFKRRVDYRCVDAAMSPLALEMIPLIGFVVVEEAAIRPKSVQGYLQQNSKILKFFSLAEWLQMRVAVAFEVT